MSNYILPLGRNGEKWDINANINSICRSRRCSYDSARVGNAHPFAGFPTDASNVPLMGGRRTVNVFARANQFVSSPLSLMTKASLIAALFSSRTSHSLCQTLFLLHDLVFNTQPQFDLKQKIQNASPASGIDHMFNVTLGRLTYAPELVWVTEETSQYLAQVTGNCKDSSCCLYIY